MASNEGQLQKHDSSQGSGKLQVTILASEWGSSNGWVSTIIRELAIQLAKFSNVQVTFFLPKCSEEDRKTAKSHNISILEAERRPGFIELNWLTFPPKNLSIDVVVGHGVKLGHQAQIIRNSHKCKWFHIVVTDAEERGKFERYEDRILKVGEEHQTEVDLCRMADFVVGIGPKLAEAFQTYLLCYQKGVFELTPGIFADFASAQRNRVKSKPCVLVFGHGDAENFKLKGFDIAAESVAALPDTELMFVGGRKKRHKVIFKRLVNFGMRETRLKVKAYEDDPEYLKRLFSEVDLVLMPSRTEPFGLIGLQALSAGVPVMVSKNSGFGEALNGVTCGSLFVINSEESSDWTAAIKVILNKDKKVQLTEVKTARDSYGERYSWSKRCKDLVEEMVERVDGLSPCVPPQRERGIEKNKSEQPAGTSSEPEITEEGARKLKRNNNFTARTSCPSHVKELVRQTIEGEGAILTVPWCEAFSLQIEDIFTRLRIVEKEKTRGIVTTNEVTSMACIFTPQEECKQPLICVD